MSSKSLIIDGSASEALKAILAQSTSNKTGLIIGAIDNNSNKDHILYFVETPQADMAKSNDKQDQSVDYDWILNHALQIHDMLVGGIDILGVYCVDSTPTVAKQLLVKLYKSLNEFDHYKKMKFNSERLAFLVDTKTKNINMKSFDVNSSDVKSTTFQSCELTTEKNLFSEQFYKLTSNYRFNSAFKTPNIKSYNLLKEDLCNALSTESMFEENKFVCLINGCLFDEEKQSLADIKQTLLKTIKERKQEDDENDEDYELDADYEKQIANNEFSATLMDNLNVSNDENIRSATKSRKETANNLDSIYELTGLSSLAILFHKSVKIKHLKKLLVYDLIRSLYARVRLLVEDLDARKDIIGDAQLDDPDSTEASFIEESYQTPNRIHVYLDQSSNFFISDYVFPDETNDDISDRIKELFNVDLKNPDEQIVLIEDVPPEIKHQNQSDEKSTQSGANNFAQNSSSNQSGTVSIANKNSSLFADKGVLIFSIIVAILSIIIAYNYFNYTENTN